MLSARRFLRTGAHGGDICIQWGALKNLAAIVPADADPTEVARAVVRTGLRGPIGSRLSGMSLPYRSEERRDDLKRVHTDPAILSLPSRNGSHAHMVWATGTT
jgi:hypothetical protein